MHHGFWIGAGLLLLAGCATGPTSSVVEIVTDPAGALVRVEGFGECETPCTVEVDKPRRATIAKAGYEALRVDIKPGARRLEIALELVAGTEEVDETALPDL